MNALVVAICPLHRDFDRHVLFFGLVLNGNNVLVNYLDLLRRVEVLDVVDESSLVEVAVISCVALIVEVDP